MSRCTGHCCKRFYLPFSPTELQRAAAYSEKYRIPGTNEYKEGWEEGFKNDHGDKVFRFYEDIEEIAGMAILLEWNNLDANGDTVVKRGHWYRCDNLDPETNNCTIYETRPNMCRRYPDSGVCDYKACTKTPGPS